MVISNNELVLKSFSTRDAICHFIKLYVQNYLESEGFEFKKNKIEFHRKQKDYTQVIRFHTSHNNWKGEIIDFGVDYYLQCPSFKTWYNKLFKKRQIGSARLNGFEIDRSKWNCQYQKWYDLSPGVHFGYDLINNDIEHQFLVILQNFQDSILPFFEKYKTIQDVIDNPKKNPLDGFEGIDIKIRQIELCLFIKDFDQAFLLMKNLKAKNLTMVDDFEDRIKIIEGLDN